MILQKSIDGERSYHALGMEKRQFREAAHKMVDVILDYHQSLESGERSALPDVRPGDFPKKKLLSDNDNNVKTDRTQRSNLHNICNTKGK